MAAHDLSQDLEPQEPEAILVGILPATWIGVGFRLARNWQRLGRPEFAAVTRWTPIACTALALLSMVGGIAWAQAFHSIHASSVTITLVLAMFYCAIAQLCAATWYQRLAYRGWKQTGRIAHGATLADGFAPWPLRIAALTAAGIIAGVAWIYLAGAAAT